MILRKPYALFIKYFRLIHVFLTALIAYSIYRTNIVLTFYNTYLANPKINSGIDFTGKNFNIYMFVVPFLIILFSIIIFSLMYFKKKPILFYVTNVSVYVFLLIVFYAAFANMDILEVRTVDVRTIRAIRDFLTAAFLLQSFSAVITFIRATGFDIKKFNFGHDLDELAIAEADREEFEVQVSVDSESIIRKYKRNLRHAKYVYVENKYLINIVVLIGLLSLGFGTLLNIYVFNKTYKQNESFNTVDLVMTVKNTYITQKDYKNILIDKDKTFVVIELELKNNYPKSIRLDSVKAELVIGNTIYKPSNTYAKKMIDLGVTYDNNLLSKGTYTYIFIYEVTNTQATKPMMFRYNNTTNFDNLNATYIKVALTPINLDKNLKTKTYKLGDEINFKDSILKDSTLKITTKDISEAFLLSYNFCASTTDCYTSYEYIKPDIRNTFDKGILFLNGTFNPSNKINVPALTNLYNLIFNFGTLKYTIGDQVKYQVIPFVQVISTKKNEVNVYYIEVIKDATTAQKLSIIFTIRNITYEYVLF